MTTEYKPFRCRCCHQHLGLTNGTRLLFVLGEGAYSDEPIPLRCSGCGLRQIWKPVRREVDIVQSFVYSDIVPA